MKILSLLIALLSAPALAQTVDLTQWVTATTPFVVSLLGTGCKDSEPIAAAGARPGGLCDVTPPVPRPTGLQLPIGCSITAANQITITACTVGLVLPLAFPSSVAVRFTNRSP